MFLLVPAYPGYPGQKAVKRLCVCVCVTVCDVIWSVDIQGVYVARPVEQQLQCIPQASTGQATEQAMGSRMAYCLHL